jgi:hypothetical protein
MENWKPVVGYEESYEVSDLGRVRSVDRVIYQNNGRPCFKKGKILSNKIDSKGYMIAQLWRNNQAYSAKVDKLVAEAFIGEPPEFFILELIDGNRSNVALSNIKYVEPEITYSGIHLRLYRERGEAKQFNCDCGAQAEEWSYDYDKQSVNERVGSHGIADDLKYSLDINDYTPRCKTCHSIFDQRDIRPECPKGHEYTEHNIIYDNGRRKCKTCVYARNRERYRKKKLQQLG